MKNQNKIKNRHCPDLFHNYIGSTFAPQNRNLDNIEIQKIKEDFRDGAKTPSQTKDMLGCFRNLQLSVISKDLSDF